jgi:hypothetical protein
MTNEENVVFYVITILGTIICMNYSIKYKVIKDIKLSSYIKEIVGFKISKIIVHEQLSICMLIEHDCLC